MGDRQFRAWVIGLSSLLVVLLTILIVVLLSVDSDSPSGTLAATTTAPTTTAAPTTTSTTSTTTTTSAATTTAAPTTTEATTTTAATTTTSGGACSGLRGAETPRPEPGVSFAEGDFDGDGELDQLIGYQDPSGTWWVQMALDSGHATQTAVPGPATALGAQDFGASGQDVGLAEVDVGASTTIVSFFYLAGCEVFEATVGTGTARFPIGGGVTHLDGLHCTPDGFYTTSATTSDGTTWEYAETSYAWVPGSGDFEAVTSSITLLTSPDDDDVIFGAGGLVCPP